MVLKFESSTGDIEYKEIHTCNISDGVFKARFFKPDGTHTITEVGPHAKYVWLDGELIFTSTKKTRGY